MTDAIDTRLIHGPGSSHDVGTGLIEPLQLSTSFRMSPSTGFSASSLDADTAPVYGRWGNPSVAALENHLANLEGAESAACFGSGMAAISAVLLSELDAGDHVIASNICYAGAAELFHELRDRHAIEVSLVDTSDTRLVANCIQPNTKVIHIETPANPILRLADIQAIAALARSADAKLVVDSTFATPLATRPLELGADLVIHSLTKYMSGHGDTLGGVVLGRQADIQQLRSAVIHFGAVLHPFAAWLIERSLQTLHLRMSRHQSNALAVARFLEGHSRVEVVRYPGLESHPQHELAKRQMRNFSGMIAFRPSQPEKVQSALCNDPQLISYAVSLGKTKTVTVLICTEEVQRTSFRLSAPELEKYSAVAGDGVFRLSVGLEDPDDIIRDLDRVLS